MKEIDFLLNNGGSKSKVDGGYKSKVEQQRKIKLISKETRRWKLQTKFLKIFQYLDK